jgi:hypothetical protein
VHFPSNLAGCPPEPFPGPLFSGILDYLPKKGAVRPLLFCRFMEAISGRDCDFAPALKDSTWAWTPFPLQPKMRIVRLAKGAFYGVFRHEVCPLLPPGVPLPEGIRQGGFSDGGKCCLRRRNPPLRRETHPQNRGSFHFSVIMPVRKPIGPPATPISAFFLSDGENPIRVRIAREKNLNSPVFANYALFGRAGSGPWY